MLQKIVYTTQFTMVFVIYKFVGEISLHIKILWIFSTLYTFTEDSGLHTQKEDSGVEKSKGRILRLRAWNSKQSSQTVTPGDKRKVNKGH